MGIEALGCITTPDGTYEIQAAAKAMAQKAGNWLGRGLVYFVGGENANVIVNTVKPLFQRADNEQDTASTPTLAQKNLSPINPETPPTRLSPLHGSDITETRGNKEGSTKTRQNSDASQRGSGKVESDKSTIVTGGFVTQKAHKGVDEGSVNEEREEMYLAMRDSDDDSEDVARCPDDDFPRLERSDSFAEIQE